MATIAENLTLLKSTKAGIKAAIEAKGVSNVGDKFSDYPAKIASIPTGGSTSGVSQWTGTVDRAGLTELGWSTTDIDNLQANVRWYDWQNPDYTVVDADKSITAINQYRYNKNVRYVKMLDTSQVTSMFYMFEGCSSLTSIPTLDTSKVTNMSSMFRDCTSLTTVPTLDTSQATDMGQMFSNCTSLTTIESIDFSSCTNTSYMFPSYISYDKLTSMHVTGSISFSWTSNGFSSIPNLDFNSIKSILEAMNRCTNPETAKTMSFNSTMTDQDSQLTNLVSECNGKGWTITGLTIN